MGDSLNSSQLYTVKLNTSVADWINMSEKTNGHPPVTAANGLPPAKVNGTQLQPTTTKSKLSEESVRETFAHFGPIKSVILPAEPGRRARHAHIREFKALFFFILCVLKYVHSAKRSFCVSLGETEFESSEDKHAALRAAEDLRKQNYLICPTLTPLHLTSWVGDPHQGAAEHDEGKTHLLISSQVKFFFSTLVS